MRWFLAPLALFLLAFCAPPPPTATYPGGPETVIAVQPATVPIYNDTSPPRGVVGATLWGPVERLPSLPTNATSSNGELAIVIDSASIPGNIAARNGLGSLVMGYSLPTFRAATWYRQTYQLRVTRAGHGPASVAQVVAYFNVLDRVNHTSLWLGQIAFDTRCSKGGDIGWDAGTNAPMRNILAAGFSCQPSGDWRSMSFDIGPTQITAAAAALRAKYPMLKLSSNPGDYSLTHANINPEIAVPAAAAARIDVGVRAWRVVTQP